MPCVTWLPRLPLCVCHPKADREAHAAALAEVEGRASKQTEELRQHVADLVRMNHLINNGLDYTHRTPPL